MLGFGKKIEIDIPDGKGGIKTIKVSRKQWDLWEKEGAVSYMGLAVRANVLDPIKGYYVTDYLLNRDIDEKAYKKFKDSNGDIYISIAYQNGERQVSIIKKELWDQLRKVFNLGEC